MAAFIELADFVTEDSIARAYRRAGELQRRHRDHRDSYAARMLSEGMNRARDRDPKCLLYLEKGAEILAQLNERETSRFSQLGYRRADYNEYTQWKEALIKAQEPRRNEDVMFRVFGWIYAAVNEAIR